MFHRILAVTLVACAVCAPAYAQSPDTTTAPDATVASATPDGSGAQVPQSPVPQSLPASMQQPGFLKQTASDYKNFFRYDTLKTLSIVGVVAVAAAPWDREGVNNGFNLPTTVFQGGNVVGNFVFQFGASAATYGIGKLSHNDKTTALGRDLVRAQLLSQGMVQAVKFTVRRERPDGSNKQSFPSGHSASSFATASILHSYFGWKVGLPAYALGSYVGLARMSWNRHHVTDVVMGAGFGIVSAKTVTMSMGKTQFSVGVQPQVGGASINFTKVNKK